MAGVAVAGWSSVAVRAATGVGWMVSWTVSLRPIQAVSDSVAVFTGVSMWWLHGAALACSLGPSRREGNCNIPID